MRLIPLIFIFILLLAGGCWDSNEINNSYVASGIAIDSTQDNQYLYTVQIPTPIPRQTGKQSRGQVPGKREPFQVISTTAPNFAQASREVSLKTPRNPLWQHTHVCIVGEDLAAKGIGGLIDHFIRNHNIRKNNYLFIAHKTTAEEVIKTSNDLEPVSSNALMSMIKAQESTLGIYTSVKLAEFIRKSLEPGIEPTVPGVMVEELEGKKTLKLDGTAVFCLGQLKGWLNEDESQGYRWLRPGTVKGGTTLIFCPVCKKPVLLTLFSSKSSIRPEIKDGRVIMHITIRQQGSFYEQGCRHHLFTRKMIPVLENEAEKAVEEKVQKAVKKAQSLGTDIFGFGRLLKATYPEQWSAMSRDWAKLFPQVEITTEVDYKIINGFLTVDSLTLRY